MVPIVEPELLIDGEHDMAAFGDASARVISRCMAHLWQKVGGRAVGRAGGGPQQGSCWTRRKHCPHICCHPALLPPPFIHQNVLLEGTLLKPQVSAQPAPGSAAGGGTADG